MFDDSRDPIESSPYHQIALGSERYASLIRRLLFGCTLLVSAGLLGLVLLAPILADEEGRFLSLFAHDATLRRTAIASAVGLAATACVFFRPPPPPKPLDNQPRPTRVPPPRRRPDARDNYRRE